MDPSLWTENAKALEKSLRKKKYSSWKVLEMRLFLEEIKQDTTGKKAELVERVKTVLGADVEKDVDIDFSTALKASDGAVRPDLKLKFPEDGWTLLCDIPGDMMKLKFSMAAAIDYFYARRAADGLPTSDYRNLGKESFGLYSRGYAREGAMLEKDGLLLLKFKFRATMKTGVRYAVNLAFRSVTSGGMYEDLVYSCCQCPGGAPPSTCKHVGGVCNGLDEYCKTGKFIGCTSSTSALCKWNAPPPQRLVSSMKFVTAPGNTDGHGEKLQRMQFDPRPPSKRAADPIAEASKMKRLLEGASSSNTPVLLELLDVGCQPVQERSLILKPVLAILSDAVQHGHKEPTDCMSFLSLTSQEVHALEYRTRQQSNCSLWHEHRSGRLTSSSFGDVVRRREDMGALADRLLLPSRSLRHIPAIKWGVEHEDTARQLYVQQKQQAQQDLRVSPSGLVVMSNGYLGCSPDGVVYDPSEPQPRGLLEIKCPFSAKHLTPAEACTDLPAFFCTLDDGKVCLRAMHPYYLQVQGAMAVFGAMWCDFVVWTEKDMSVERIRLAGDSWSQQWQPKLTAFYQQHMLPRLFEQAKVIANKPASTSAISHSSLPDHVHTLLPVSGRTEAVSVSTCQPPTSESVAATAIIGGQDESKCCSGCAFTGLTLRKCAKCGHSFHHMCTSHDLGKFCKCCCLLA